MLLYSCNEGTKDKVSSSRTEGLFELIPSSASGITFKNELHENIEAGQSLFSFDYFYNGSGVGVADINNDGLQDIFFCANQSPNRLYLNKGNFQFEDITDKAGINVNKHWSTGVTFADVNGDGFIDIYVSQGGPLGANRKNALYINNGDLTFIEAAEKYNLADDGISSQAAFFDFDKDDDLDCFVMNENPLYGIDPKTFNQYLQTNPELLPHTTSRLYRNDNGKFSNITKEAGLLRPTFGLGLSVSDINNDGWQDIYISNDYFIPDAMYINNGNGTFNDEIKTRTQQVPMYGMGVDIADVNNDGFQDILSLDMASQDHIRSKTLMPSMNTRLFHSMVDDLNYHYQYMYNALQLNAGNNHFSNVAHQSGLAKTDWSWAALMTDFDLDGDKDIAVTNGYRKYGTDNDFKNRLKTLEEKYKKLSPQMEKQLYDSMPSEKLINFLYENKGGLSFEDASKKWGFTQPSFSNGAVYADLDNDGDMDMLINNIDDEAFVYKNTAVEKGTGNFLKVKVKGKLSESFPKIYVKSNGQQQMIEVKRIRGYLSACEDVADFGLGTASKADTVRIEWPSGKFEEQYNVKTNTTIEFNEVSATKPVEKNNASPALFTAAALNFNYTHIENSYNDFLKEILLPYKQSALGPFVNKADLNGDGQDDILIGGSSGNPAQLFIQTAAGFSLMTEPAFEADKQYEDMEAVIFDFDGDGDNDIYMVSGGNEFAAGSKLYEDRIYINDGKGNLKRLADPVLQKTKYSGCSVAAIDYDRDGKKDLIVPGRIVPQNYPRHAPSFIFKNEGGKLKDVTAAVAPDLKEFGMINKIIVTDFDNDGWQDFIVAGEWTHIGLFKNNKGVFKDISADNHLSEENGWWLSIAETDVNKDGLKDYIIGNWGENSKYHASMVKPLNVFSDDFDNNGTPDIVLSYQYKGKDVPLRGLECSSQQMPFIKTKFPSYKQFANASLGEILGDKLSNSYHRKATGFHSIILINKGNGKFEERVLPWQAQMFPLLSCIAKDVNNDGYEDLIMLGNMYQTEVETPRLDGGKGLVLLSNKKDGYTPMSLLQSGLYLDGDFRRLLFFNHALSGKSYLMAFKNNGAPVKYGAVVK